MATVDAHTRDWLKALGSLIAPSMTQQEFAGRINVLAGAVAREFPPGAFCPASLAHVARQCRFFPNFAELCEHLSPWWKEHRPTPVALTSDQPSTVRNREIAREARESWQNITPEQVRTKIRVLNGNPKADELGHFLATALSKHAPHHLGLLPPLWLKDRAEPADVVKLRQWADA